MAIVTGNGCDFTCLIQGVGAELVIIHCEIDGAAYWQPQLVEFARDHRCLVYERRGHKGSFAPPVVVTRSGVRLCRPSERVPEVLPSPDFGTLFKEDGEIVEARKR